MAHRHVILRHHLMAVAIALALGAFPVLTAAPRLYAEEPSPGALHQTPLEIARMLKELTAGGPHDPGPAQVPVWQGTAARPTSTIFVDPYSGRLQ